MTLSEFKTQRRLKAAAAGASIGLTHSFLLPAAEGMITYDEEYALDISLQKCLVETLGGAAAALVSREVLSLASGRIGRERLNSDVSKLRTRVANNIQAAATSYNAIFSSYMDEHVVEEEIYGAHYDLLVNSQACHTLKNTVDALSEDLGKLQTEILKIETRLKEIAREEEAAKTAEPDKDQAADLPAYTPSTKYTEVNPEKAELSAKLNQKRDLFKLLDGEHRSTAVKLSEVLKQDAQIGAAIEGMPKRLALAMANRRSRDLYVKVFVDSMKAAQKDLSAMEMSGHDGDELAYIKSRLREVHTLILSVERDYREFVEQFKRSMSDQGSSLQRIKRKTKGRDMTYSGAPFWKIFQVYADPTRMINSEAYRLRFREILEGAQQDYAQGNERGTWLKKRNYSESWQFSIGEFSDEEAMRLAELLGIEIDLKTSIKTVNDAYKVFVKQNHSDLSEGTADEVVAECSTLVKKFRGYHKNLEALWSNNNNKQQDKVEVEKGHDTASQI